MWGICFQQEVFRFPGEVIMARFDLVEKEAAQGSWAGRRWRGSQGRQRKENINVDTGFFQIIDFNQM